MTATDLSSVVHTSIQLNWGGEAAWAAIAGTAVLISFLVVAIAYMLSEILRMPSLQAWAKNELVETATSLLLVVALLSSLVVLNSIVSDLTSGVPRVCVGDTEAQRLGFYQQTGGLNHFGVAAEYLCEARSDLTWSYVKLLVFDAVVGTLGTLGASIFLPVTVTPTGITVPGVGLSPLAGLSVVNTAIVQLADMAALVILNLLAQQALLEFIQETFFTFFLPMGLILRTFALTRRLGATLIAFSIAGYVVFPLTLAFNKGAYEFDKDWTTGANGIAPSGITDVIPSQFAISPNVFSKVFFIGPYGIVDSETTVPLTFKASAPAGNYSISVAPLNNPSAITWAVPIGNYAPNVPVKYDILNMPEGDWNYTVYISFVNSTACAGGAECQGAAMGTCDTARGYCIETANNSIRITAEEKCEWVGCRLYRGVRSMKYLWSYMGWQSASLAAVGAGGVISSPFLAVVGVVGSTYFAGGNPLLPWVMLSYDMLTCDKRTAAQACSTCGIILGESGPDGGCPTQTLTFLPPMTTPVLQNWSVPVMLRKLLMVTVLTVADIIMVITFFRALSGTLGGETQLAGLSKII